VNQPPREHVRVTFQALDAFLRQAGLSVGMADDQAALLARTLATNELRGVWSHGALQMATYAPLMREGKLNSRPNLSVARETASSVLVDGDGGLGYFPAFDAAKRIIAKAESAGVAVGLTRNHGHIGAAGVYARMTTEHDLLCFVTSGHQLHLEPGQDMYHAAGGSPMAFSAPTKSVDPLVLDFGTMHDLYAGNPHRADIARMAPGLVLRSIGLGEVCQAWGGLLAGLKLRPDGAPPGREGANQGSVIIAFRIDLFIDPGEFRHRMDEYARAVWQTKPIEGIQQAYLPGQIEMVLERKYRAEGIPLPLASQSRLEALAKELGLRLPFTA
jgi:LDH2 family malate/lactate/ureidoglycolate dehydrogenase